MFYLITNYYTVNNCVWTNFNNFLKIMLFKKFIYIIFKAKTYHQESFTYCIFLYLIKFSIPGYITIQWNFILLDLGLTIIS